MQRIFLYDQTEMYLLRRADLKKILQYYRLWPHPRLKLAGKETRPKEGSVPRSPLR